MSSRHLYPGRVLNTCVQDILIYTKKVEFRFIFRGLLETQVISFLISECEALLLQQAESITRFLHNLPVSLNLSCLKLISSTV